MENTANTLVGEHLFPSPHHTVTSLASLQDGDSDVCITCNGKQYQFTTDQRRSIASSLIEGMPSVPYSICTCLMSVPGDILDAVLAHVIVIGDGRYVCDMAPHLTHAVKEMVTSSDKFAQLRPCMEKWAGIVEVTENERWRGYCVAESLQLLDKAIREVK